jgi:hypothetical protein
MGLIILLAVVEDKHFHNLSVPFLAVPFNGTGVRAIAFHSY